MIDPDFRTVARSVRLDPAKASPQAARPVAVTADAVWIAGSGREIARAGSASTARTSRRSRSATSPSAIAVGAGARLGQRQHGRNGDADRPAHERGRRHDPGRRQSASGIAVGAGGVWVPVPLEDRVKRIDPATNAITDTVRVARRPRRVAIGAGAVWVTSRRGGTVTRIDPATARVTRTVPLGHSPQGVAVVDGAVWVAVQASPARRRSRPRPRCDVLARAPPGAPSQRHGPRARFAGQPQVARDLRAAAQLPRPSRFRPARSWSRRSRASDADGQRRRAHLHVPPAPRLPVLAALQRAGDRARRSAARSSAAAPEDRVLRGGAT